eukprot:m.210554 g.210554  ORF g.210554 m.210554 type:complete len:358 (+) comp15556_c1_seq5:2909-3982(+)
MVRKVKAGQNSGGGKVHVLGGRGNKVVNSGGALAVAVDKGRGRVGGESNRGEIGGVESGGQERFNKAGRALVEIACDEVNAARSLRCLEHSERLLDLGKGVVVVLGLGDIDAGAAQRGGTYTNSSSEKIIIGHIGKDTQGERFTKNNSQTTGTAIREAARGTGLRTCRALKNTVTMEKQLCLGLLAHPHRLLQQKDIHLQGRNEIYNIIKLLRHRVHVHGHNFRGKLLVAMRIVCTRAGANFKRDARACVNTRGQAPTSSRDLLVGTGKIAVIKEDIKSDEAVGRLDSAGELQDTRVNLQRKVFAQMAPDTLLCAVAQAPHAKSIQIRAHPCRSAANLPVSNGGGTNARESCVRHLG